MAHLIWLRRGLVEVAAAEDSAMAAEREEEVVASAAEFVELRLVRAAASEFLVGEFPVGAGLSPSVPHQGLRSRCEVVQVPLFAAAERLRLAARWRGACRQRRGGRKNLFGRCGFRRHW